MTATLVQQKLHVEPISFHAACQHIALWHRHHGPPVGHIFSRGVFLPDWTLVGVATAGRPVSRLLDDGLTVEVTRVATDGTPNACSALYAACRRDAYRKKFTRVITYTQDGESGSSLRGAGWIPMASLAPRRGWYCPSRPRDNSTGGVARIRWEAPAMRRERAAAQAAPAETT
jgi:hypothetical protein